MEPGHNEPLYNEDLGITNDFLYRSNSKIYEKEPRHNETSMLRTNFVSPLAPRYIDFPLQRGVGAYYLSSLEMQSLVPGYPEKGKLSRGRGLNREFTVP